MIYFDYGATSIKRKEILQEIMDDFDTFNGNPDSQHTYGRRARRILEEAREVIAKSINAKPSQIIFTSGASESNNTVINAFAKDHIVTTSIEHPSILNAIKNRKIDATLIRPNRDGSVDLSEVKKAIEDKTKLLSFIYVNNEVGTINPVKELGELAKSEGLWYHLDAVQAYGHIDIDVEDLACDSMSLSGHKIGGLNGFGVLYLRNKLDNLIYGGNQEKKRRAGTSFIAGAFSMAKAFPLMLKERDKIRGLKRRFINKLKDEKVNFELNSRPELSSDHILNLYLPFVKSDFLLTYLDINGVCASAGSACTAGSLEASFVVANIYDEKRANHSVRFSFGFDNSIEDVDRVVDLLKSLQEKVSNEGK
ncbi:MAG: cysteine desulfurase family protein [Tissierellia bacterium]|nr:cysteine desulfurase family protein [Tissierellia bacterium]